MPLIRILRDALAAGCVLAAIAADANAPVSVPLQDRGAATYYVQARIHGLERMDFMVDTGSGYVVIDEDMLVTLEEQGNAEYLREFLGVMADGSTVEVPVYQITSIDIGNQCVIHGVEVAVFPSGTRCILGMNALKRAAPFTISMNPPSITFSNCG